MNNDIMDELEHAADCGLDAVCANEYQSDHYGLIPSPNLTASRCSTNLFIEQGIPEPKDVRAGWLDRWWPKPMETHVRAEAPGFLPKLAAE